MVSSVRWGYVRIIAGTLVGGILGFYVMHRAELSYKEKWNERLKKYEEELNKKKEKANELEDIVDGGKPRLQLELWCCLLDEVPNPVAPDWLLPLVVLKH
ncbi:hypothetical protein HYC85_004988 [Camellia sinensis]|uniref:Uncharacterized protein n=1 Tax=Camellia sinensis TaxID=4442 RepID=A0A7J7HY47_CAMSI|nr:hypothetical protein HYC85_004988 [Camellia sinensis]